VPKKTPARPGKTRRKTMASHMALAACVLLVLGKFHNWISITRFYSCSVDCPVFGRPFVKRFALCYRTVVCPVGDVGVLWPNSLTDQDETWHAGTPRPWPHCVRWGPSSPSPRGEGRSLPNFRPISVAAK